MATIPSETVLLVTTGAVRCALPISSVVETLRELPLRSFKGMPPFVLGVSVIRGEALPVLDLARLFGGTSIGPARLVVVWAGQHKVALAVDRVIGIHRLDSSAMAAAPPLLSSMAPDVVASLGPLDGELLTVLRLSHLVPDDLWLLLQERGGL